MKYFLGVDGGNTKTDYLLCTIDGEFVDVYRTSTCSHETFDNSYDGMEKAMKEQMSALFKRNNIGIEDIASAGFGLAGADLPSQIVELKKRVEKIGIKRYGLFNDGILGIKGASDSGTGLCAVNGTGTVIVGIDNKGEILQVSGVNQMSGDQAGGGYIRNRIMSVLYDYHFRCGDDSIMFPKLMDLLKAKAEDMLNVVSDYPLLDKNGVAIIQTAADAAVAGDPVAKNIFDEVGKTIGKSAAGCIRRLSFPGTVDIVLVGTIWHKVPYDGMKNAFVETTEHLSGKSCRCITLQAPAAVGGVLWAKEIADGKNVPVDYRKKVLDAITIDKYESLAFLKK